MNQVTLKSISALKSEKARKNGKVSRQYYTATFADANNPFAKDSIRNFFQAHNAEGTVAFWRGGDPAVVSRFVGKQIPGAIVNKQVETYKIDGRDVNNYTTVVLGNENTEAVFKSAGHKLAGASKPEVVEMLEADEVLN